MAKALDPEKLVSLQRLKELLHYDPDTGIFTWLVDKVGGGPSGRLGMKAGGRKLGSGGYVIICVDYQRYKAHRLAWFYMTGDWLDQIDHIDRVKANNRFGNLRPASQSQNAINGPLRPTNKSGYVGVCFATGRQQWLATICINGKTQATRCKSFEEAKATRIDLERRHYGEFARSA